MKLKLSTSNWIQLLFPQILAFLFLFFAKSEPEQISGFFSGLISIVYQFVSILILPEGNLTYFRCLAIANFYIILIMVAIILPGEYKQKTGRSFETKHARFDEYRTVKVDPYVPDSVNYFLIILLHIIIIVLYFKIGNHGISNYNENTTPVIDSIIQGPVEVAPSDYQETYIDSLSNRNDTLSYDYSSNDENNLDKYYIGQELNGGVIVHLNENKTGGLLMFDAKMKMDFNEAENWCSELNLRLPSIEEMQVIISNYDITKDYNIYYWSSELANEYDKKNYDIGCRTTSRNGAPVSVEDNDYVKCFYALKKEVILNEPNCHDGCYTIGIKSF